MDDAANFAIGRLFEEHGRSLRALAGHLLAEPAAADDVVQEAALVAMTKAPRGVRDLRAWVTTVVRHLAYRSRRADERRARRDAIAVVREVDESPASAVAASSTAQALARAETLRLLANAVAELAEPYRRTIVLRFFEELTPAAIALREQCPEATVRTRLRRALEQLRTRLDVLHPGGRESWLGSIALELTVSGLRSSAATMSGTTANVVATKATASNTAVAGALPVLSLPKLLALAVLLLALVTMGWRFGWPGAGRAGPTAATASPSAGASAADPPLASFSTLLTTPADARTVPLADGVTVRGRAIDLDGLPVANAKVVWGTWYVEAGERKTAMGFDLVTDSDGRFTIRGLRAGADLIVEAGLPGRCPGELKAPVRVADALELAPLVITPGESIAGVVVDGAGQPIVGARLFASNRLCGGLELPESPPLDTPAIAVGEIQMTQSGADGTFRMSGLVPSRGGLGDERWVGVVVEPEAASTPEMISALEPTTPPAPVAARLPLATLAMRAPMRDDLRLVLVEPPHGFVRLHGDLPAGAALTVTVEAFAPWVETADRARLPEHGRDVAVKLAAALAASPTEAGVWEFACPFTPALLRARAELPGRPRSEAFALVASSEPVAIDLTLASGAVVAGRVVDAATNEPVAGARLLSLPNDHARDSLLQDAHPTATATSDATGRFELPAAGEWAFVRVVHPDYAPTQCAPIEMAKITGLADVRLTRGATLTVRVIDEDGDPWTHRANLFLGARSIDALVPSDLSARRLDDEWWGQRATLSDQRQPDGEGTFRWTHLPAGEYQLHLLRPADDEFLGATERECVVREGESIEVVFQSLADESRATLSGTLLVNGDVPEGCSISFSEPSCTRLIGPAAELDGDGEFEIVAPANRPLLLAVQSSERNGFSRRIGIVAPFHPGEERELHLDLDYAPIGGRVIDAESGEPLAGAQVELLGGSWPTIEADGRLTLSPSATTIGMWHAASLKSHASRVTVDASGKPNISGPPVTDGAGKFVTESVSAGCWRLLVAASGCAPVVVDASFTDAPPSDLIVRLAHVENELVLTVPPAAPDPFNPGLPTWTVTARSAAIDAACGGPQTIELDPRIDGDQLIVTHLPAGELTIAVAPYRFASTTSALPAGVVVTFDMPATGRVERTLAPPIGGALVVLLLDAAGVPVIDAGVALFDVDGSELPAFDTMGRWSSSVEPRLSVMPRQRGGRRLFTRLRPGPVHVVATFADGGRAELQAEIVAGRASFCTLAR